MKSEYYPIKLTKKWVKNRVFYGKEFLGFFRILKIKNGNTNYQIKNKKVELMKNGLP
jgi:hypothetical protein